jgi:phospho-N-acetylmuramoyl-pentapeptide-transferase
VTAIIVGAGLALLIGLVGTRMWIALLAARGYGQYIRDDGPTTHHVKRGTPTMGGAVVVLAAVVGYLVAHLVTLTPLTASGMLVLFLTTGLGAVGFIDDYLKVSRRRSLGFRSGPKAACQIAISLVFALAVLLWPESRGISIASPTVSFIRDTPLVLPAVLFVLWVLLIVAGTSNAVNLTDGLDGLAAGASVMVLASYVVIGVWEFGKNCAQPAADLARCYPTRDPYDLALVAAVMVGALFGFLWWNAPPAKIFMGDTGSLAIGGALAGLAITTRTELLLPILGGLFVVITASVIIQVGWFRLSGGKRVFRMAPLQHHFEMLGWQEITVTIRFWIVAGIFVATGMGVFYAEWVARA